MNKLNDAADSQDLDPVSLPPNKDILRNPEQYKPKRKQMKFTSKQEKFIQLYVYHDLTNVECAHRAGYAFPAPEATKMLNDPRYVHIQNKILELRELEQKKYEITFEKVARIRFEMPLWKTEPMAQLCKQNSDAQNSLASW